MHKLVNSTKNRLKALVAQRDRGATAAEYALIVAAVIVGISVIVGLFATAIGQNFTDVTNRL